MSQALRTLRRLASKAPTSSPVAWRLELETLDEEARYAWEERVAIMLEGAGLSLEQAEKAAFLEVCLYRTGTR